MIDIIVNLWIESNIFSSHTHVTTWTRGSSNEILHGKIYLIIFGSLCWSFMDHFVRGCSTYLLLNPLHMYGLVCIEIFDETCGWMVSVAYLKDTRLSLGLVQFSVLEFMGTLPKSIVGPQYSTLVVVKPNAQNATLLTYFHEICVREKECHM